MTYGWPIHDLGLVVIDGPNAACFLVQDVLSRKEDDSSVRSDSSIPII